MFFLAKALSYKDVPASGGSLDTIAGSGGKKLPVQVLNFTQDVTGNISVPDGFTYGYFQINMGSNSIDGNGSACFTNNNVFDISVNGSGTINSNLADNINTSGSGTSNNIAGSGVNITVSNNTSTQYYTSFSTTITQNNSPFSGNQTSGNWNVIRENAGSGTGTWSARILDANVNLSGNGLGKNLVVKKNGSTVVNLTGTSSTQSWSVNGLVPGDYVQWTCSGGIGGGGTINRPQRWNWSGTGDKIAYYANTGGGKSGTFYTKTISLLNNNTDDLHVTLKSGTTGITSDNEVGDGGTRTLQGNSPTISTSSWSLVATIPVQTQGGVLYSAVPAFDGTNTTTDASGVPTDGITLTGFSGNFNRVI
jgi:hypothetical protein